jgi:hypothetical protein
MQIVQLTPTSWRSYIWQRKNARADVVFVFKIVGGFPRPPANPVLSIRLSNQTTLTLKENQRLRAHLRPPQNVLLQLHLLRSLSPVSFWG